MLTAKHSLKSVWGLIRVALCASATRGSLRSFSRIVLPLFIIATGSLAESQTGNLPAQHSQAEQHFPQRTPHGTHLPHDPQSEQAQLANEPGYGAGRFTIKPNLNHFAILETKASRLSPGLTAIAPSPVIRNQPGGPGGTQAGSA
jgi:hypothetical protein